MSKPERDPGRGQLHKRSARAWRDEANPTGPGVSSDEDESEEAEGATEGAPERADADESANTEEPVNAGPGGGGATESGPGHPEHEGQHGGPSSKT